MHFRRTLSLAALLVLAGASPAAAQGGMDLPSLIERVRPAVVRISTFDANGQPLGSGSGFYGPDGRVITNAHVLEGAARAEIFDPDGRLQGTTQYAEVSSTTVDIAILPRMGNPPVQLSMAGAAPRVGESVVVIGSPLGLTNTVSDGLVSGMRTEEGQHLIQISAPISRGSSGGPVLNRDGEVIGVAVALLQGGQNLNFAVPASDVRALLQSPAGRYAFAPAASSGGSGQSSAGGGRASSRPSDGSATDDWVEGASYNGRTEYVSRESVRVLRSGHVEVQIGRVHAEPHTDDLGDTYNLELVTYELDCRGHRNRLVKLTQFLDEELVYQSQDDMSDTWNRWTAAEWTAHQTFPIACQLAGR